MKMILFSVTISLAVFSFNISHSQDASVSYSKEAIVDELLDKTSVKLKAYMGDMGTIHKALGKIAHSYRYDESQFDAILSISSCISDVAFTFKWQVIVLSTKDYVDRRRMKPYYQNIYKTLMFSYGLSQSNYKKINDHYPYLQNQPALHSADKAKKLLSESISAIEATILVLEKVMISM